MTWPAAADVLLIEQEKLGRTSPERWRPPTGPLTIGGCYVCFARGASGSRSSRDPAWTAAVAWREGLVIGEAAVTGIAGAAYEPGLLALREGLLLEAAVQAMAVTPEALLVDATGRDHPRRAGLALQLGAILDVPTVGVTHRPLVASGEWPPDDAGAHSPLVLDRETVGYWLRTRIGTRPLAVHAAWRTDPELAVELVLRSLLGSRTPEPLRLARTLARNARASAAASPA